MKISSVGEGRAVPVEGVRLLMKDFKTADLARL